MRSLDSKMRASLIGIGLAFAVSAIPKAGGLEAATRPQSEWVQPSSDGKLVYKTTPAGDRLMDFSYAGYMGGGVALPEVPIKITLKPAEGDSTAAIQEAIDKVSALSVGAKDLSPFRGAVLLAPGDYTCSGTISIRTTGVVLRGSGSGAGGSTIKMVGGRHAAITIGAARGQRADRAESKTVETSIADAYVPSGTTTFAVADAAGLAVGDTISLRRPITPAWIHFMQMDDLVRDGRPQTWLSTGRNDSMERTITALAGNKITVDIPLSDSFDAKYLNPPGSTVTKVRSPVRVTQVGLEHLHIQCPPLEIAYGQAPYSAIRIGGDDCWVRDVFCEETMNSTTLAGKRITMQEVVVQHTFANLGASKPTDFSIEGSQNLLDRCRIAGGNMYFVWTGSLEPGPNVLLNCTFTGKGSRVQPHMRWSTGMLVDNCHVPEGSIDFMNRGVMGSGHGWTMGWAVAWNCTAKGYYIQNPPGAVNWAIGCIGASMAAPRPFDKSPNLPQGIFDSPGKPVAPQSLYLAQLAERLGPQAAKDIGYAGDKDFRSLPKEQGQDALATTSKTLGVDLAEHRPVNASNVRGSARAFGGEKALDGDPNTYWTTNEGVTRASLEVDLEGAQEISAVELQEAAGLGQRVQEYKVEGQVDSDWKLLAQGTTIGDRKLDHFPAVTVWKVRLAILKAGASPAIRKFGLHLDHASSPTAGEPAKASAERAGSEWVHAGPEGKLTYKTTPAGDRIMDFSHAGYMGGGVALPQVLVKITVKPVEGDNTAAIQEAIDKVSALNLENGLRGAVLLAPGDYTCSGTISIRAGGVVLRGSGSGADGSTIKMAGGRHGAIIVGGSGGARGRRFDEVRVEGVPPSNRGQDARDTTIADAYVPSGATTFTVADAAGFAVGDAIEIHRPVTPAWVHFMQMDNLTRDGRPQTWIRTGTSTPTQRTIAALSGNKITLDVPLSDSFDGKYLNPPGTAVVKARPRELLAQVGVEHLRIQAPPMEVSYTQYPYTALRINGEDCWARDIRIEETMNSVSVGGRRITLERVAIDRTVPNLGASKPAEFAPNAGQVLLDRCSSTGDNIWHVATGAGIVGPIVLLNCTFRGNGHIEGHQRWTTGMLLDNCQIPEGGIDFKNRGAMGSGHGWGVGWAVAWNCVAKTFVVQQPPGAANWMIGCTGTNVPTPRPFDSSPTLPLGISDSPGKPVWPQSLYLAQLAERLGPQAVKNIGY